MPTSFLLLVKPREHSPQNIGEAFNDFLLGGKHVTDLLLLVFFLALLGR